MTSTRTRERTSEQRMKNVKGIANQQDRPGEEWRPVANDYADFGYEVSNLGRVRRVYPDAPHRAPLVLSPGPTSKGYLSVCFTNGVRGSGRSFLVHRLVLEAFVGPCPAGKQAGHKDLDRNHNELANLTWWTKLESAARVRELGHEPQGVTNGRAQLCEADVRAIRDPQGLTQRELAEIHEVSVRTISDIQRRRAWKHVP